MCIALVFGFAMWSAIILGAGGRVCTPKFEWSAARGWWEIYSITGAVYMVPVVGVLATLAYFAASRVRVLQRPAILAPVAAIVVVATFALSAALTTPNGRCNWP